jgi:hypothetical protein
MFRTTSNPLQEFIHTCEHMLSDDITADKLTDEELAIVQMYLDMLGQKFLLPDNREY